MRRYMPNTISSRDYFKNERGKRFIAAAARNDPSSAFSSLPRPPGRRSPPALGLPRPLAEEHRSVISSSMEDQLSPPLQEVMLEFRAGRMFLDGTRVVPDSRKGLVRIGRGEEGLVHFQWFDRGLNTLEEDQIVLPDEAIFEKVGQSSGRVYLLKFTSDSRKLFFWMQEPSSDADTEICAAVNIYLNTAIVEAEPSAPHQTSERSEDTVSDEISSRVGNDQSLTSELANEATSAGPVQLVDLQRILRSIQPGGAAEEQDGGLGLGDILKPDLVLPLIETLPLEQRLTSYLPEGSWTSEDFVELLQSPPFRQQVEMFTHVLRTGQLDLSQFGIDPSKYKFTVLSFLEALDDSVTKETGESEAGQDENMDFHSQRCGGGDAMDES